MLSHEHEFFCNEYNLFKKVQSEMSILFYFSLIMKLQSKYIKSFPLFLTPNFPSILSLQYKPSFSSPSSVELCCCCCFKDPTGASD